MINRRNTLRGLAALPMAALASNVHGFGPEKPLTNADINPFAGPSIPNLPKAKITKVKAILTAPQNIDLVIVKVETDQPGLYGVGCASFTFRAKTVQSAVNDYLDEFCRGRDATNIEDIWQMAYVSSYWRNGPVLNNALSGLDMALWDIKGKMAGMPVYQLLGGKCRFAVDTYTHAYGSVPEETLQDVLKYREKGFRHIRIQVGGYGSTHMAQDPDYKKNNFGMPDDFTINAQAYKRGVVSVFDKVRKEIGDDVELLHDVHERIEPMDAIDLLKKLEQYRPFFIEDPLSPENMDWFPLIRQQTSVPIAMGELHNNPHEWINPISKRYFDFIRFKISQIGGITPAMKISRLAEWFNVRTAWHGPRDTSPVGHAANGHVSLATWNFGILEMSEFPDKVQEVFPGCPTFKNGYMYVNEAPGLGIDIDEEKAKKYPLPPTQYKWTQLRKGDGTPVRP